MKNNAHYLFLNFYKDVYFIIKYKLSLNKDLHKTLR